MIIAYLTSVYARASDTFVRGEVRALREMGHAVHTFSVRRAAADAAINESIRSEQASTLYLLEQGALRLALATLREAIRSPARMLKAIQLARGVSQPGIKGRLWSAIYLAEAALLAGHLRAAGVRHLHNHIGENSAAVAMMAAALAGIPYSLTIHGPGEFDHPLDLALDLKVSRAEFAVTISQFTRSQLCRWVAPNHWPKIHVVHCGVDESFLDAAPSPSYDKSRFVCVARLAPEKGHHVLLAALAILKSRGLEPTVDIIGDGPLRGELEAAARDSGLDGLVTFRGSLSAEDVRSRLMTARALAQPSFAEGLPVVMMEAFALRRPVITTYIAGIPELVHPGLNGWLVPAGSAEALADAMADCLATPDYKLAEMGASGAASVRERHSADVEVRKLADLIARRRAPAIRASPLEPVTEHSVQ